MYLFCDDFDEQQPFPAFGWTPGVTGSGVVNFTSDANSLPRAVDALNAYLEVDVSFPTYTLGDQGFEVSLKVVSGESTVICLRNPSASGCAFAVGVDASQFYLTHQGFGGVTPLFARDTAYHHFTFSIHGTVRPNMGVGVDNRSVTVSGLSLPDGFDITDIAFNVGVVSVVVADGGSSADASAGAEVRIDNVAVY
jgi:hypothetical protein